MRRGEGDQLLDIVRRGQPDGSDPADLADVTARLLRGVDAHPDELEGGVADDLGDDHPPDESRPPHHDPFRLHPITLP